MSPEDAPVSRRRSHRMPRSNLDLAATVDGARVIVLAGGGGVGKTTTAAAIGLGLAARGQRVCVLTIDPARRLADALGIEELGNEPAQVPARKLAHTGANKASGGELWALMLDVKSTWDGVIRRHAGDEAAAQRILSNRIYREVSGAVAGSQEYMAVEKLSELLQARRWDVVILDTPPTRNALDFLDAPQRLHSFLDSRALQLLLKPSLGGLGLVGKGAGVFTGLMKRVTGTDLLGDLTEFFTAIGDLTEGFSQRAKAVQAVLAEPRTVFLLVASPRPDSLAEAGDFRATLKRKRIRFGGLVVNRVARAALGADEDAVREALSAALDEAGAEDDGLAAAAAAMHEGIRDEAARDAGAIAAHLREQPDDDELLLVPQLADDVHDVSGLARLDEHLFVDR